MGVNTGLINIYLDAYMNLNTTNPYVDVDAYVETEFRLPDWQDYESRYAGMKWLLLVVGVVDMRKVVYFKDTGLVDRLIGIDQEIDVYFYHFPQEYKENLDYIIMENPPRDIENYKVIDGELVRLSKQEIKKS